MSKLRWLPEHADQLKRLRLAAGVEITTLAKKHSLSSAQVRQLEESGESTFYSPEIKYTVGRKLIRSLGEEITELDFAKTFTSSTFEVAQPSINVSDLQRTLLKSDWRLSNVQKFGLIKFFGMLLALIVVWYGQLEISSSMQFLVFNPTYSDAKEPYEKTQQREAHANQIDYTFREQPKDFYVDQPLECDWNSPSVDLTPSSRFRPASYTYLIAAHPTVFCWKDSANVDRKISLKLNDSIKLEGEPPFHIYITDISDVKIYYLGNLIRAPNPEVKHIFLTKE